MASLGSLIVNIGASTQQLRQGVNDASSILVNFQNKMGSMIKNGILLNFGSDIYNGIKQGTEQAIRAGIQYNSMIEQNTVAFNTLLGSASEANKMMTDIQEMAARTPFETAGLTNNVKLMTAYGFEAQKTLGMLTTMGDAAAALGAGNEGIERITRALGQTRAKGKVQAQEMNQLAELGIPAWEMLAEAAGKSIAYMMKQSENGAIKADWAIKAILDGMNARYAGSMEAQSKTYFGMLSTAKDYAKQLSGTLTAPLFDFMKVDIFQTLIDKFTAFKSVAEQSGLKEAFKTIFPEDIVENTSSIVDSLKGIVGGVVDYVASKKDTIIGVVTNVTGKIAELLDYVNNDGEKIVPVAGGIAAAFIAMRGVPAIIATVTTAVGGLRLAITALSAHPAIALTTALAALVVGYIAYKNASDDFKTKTLEQLEAMRNETEATDKLIARYEWLKEQTKLTTDEKTELHDIEVKLAELYPSSVDGIDKQNKAYTDQIDLVKELNAEKKRQIQNDLEFSVAKNEKNIQKWQDKRNKIPDEIKKAQEKQQIAKQQIEDMNSGKLWEGFAGERRYNAVGVWEDASKQIKKLQEEEQKLTGQIEEYWEQLEKLDGFDVKIDWDKAYAPDSAKAAIKKLAADEAKTRKEAQLKEGAKYKSNSSPLLNSTYLTEMEKYNKSVTKQQKKIETGASETIKNIAHNISNDDTISIATRNMVESLTLPFWDIPEHFRTATGVMPGNAQSTVDKINQAFKNITLKDMNGDINEWVKQFGSINEKVANLMKPALDDLKSGVNDYLGSISKLKDAYTLAKSIGDEAGMRAAKQAALETRMAQADNMLKAIEVGVKAGTLQKGTPILRDSEIQQIKEISKLYTEASANGATAEQLDYFKQAAQTARAILGYTASNTDGTGFVDLTKGNITAQPVITSTPTVTQPVNNPTVPTNNTKPVNNPTVPTNNPFNPNINLNNNIQQITKLNEDIAKAQKDWAYYKSINDSFGMEIAHGAAEQARASLARLQAHADGGIFTRSTIWGNHLIGEAGNEALMPLDKLDSMLSEAKGSNNQTIVQVYVDGKMIDQAMGWRSRINAMI